ncbi:hypothetical protein BDV95DRAFT_617664 [Massariosphaeria phaeospora]|uniref:NmrA-like domain-containing protein n=1 Tax=Massariosphaeria phaeospora TaxID=100035 RepID=A0A7C8MDW9_9PLEO|nr:hypothetical protein BDV95DRAFT_617664 [Massariosphaeria phaeospora]
MADPLKTMIIADICSREGTAIALAFLKFPQTWTVKGLTRDVRAASSRRLQTYGVDIQPFDNSTPETDILDYFQGANVIVAATSFRSHLFEHSTHSYAAVDKRRSLAEIASVCETQQGVKILRAANEVSTLERLILVTQPSGIDQDGLFRGMWSFKGKFDTRAYLEGNLWDLANKTSYLQPGLPMDGYIAHMKRVSIDGTQHELLTHEGLEQFPQDTFTFGLTCHEDTVLPWTCRNDIGFFAHLLVYLPTQNLAAVSDYKSGAEIREMIQRIGGVRTTWQQSTVADLERHNPHRGQLLADIWAHVERSEGYFSSDLGALPPAYMAAQYGMVIPTTSFEAFLEVDLPAKFRGEVEPASAFVSTPAPETEDDFAMIDFLE